MQDVQRSLFVGGSYCITILASIALWAVLKRSNRQKEKNHRNDANERAKLAFQDLTDKQNPFFVYSV